MYGVWASGTFYIRKKEHGAAPRPEKVATSATAGQGNWLDLRKIGGLNLDKFLTSLISEVPRTVPVIKE